MADEERKPTLDEILMQVPSPEYSEALFLRAGVEIMSALVGATSDPCVLVKAGAWSKLALERAARREAAARSVFD